MIASLLMRAARRAMPAGKAAWLNAMASELPHIPQAERSAFALGCLKTSLSERIRTMTATPPLRIMPGLFGAALLVVLCLANVVKFLGGAPVVGAFLLMAAMLWLAILIAVQQQSARVVAQCGVVGALLYASVGLLSLSGLPAFAADGAFLQALAVEGLVLFAAVFAIAHIPYFWAMRGAGEAA